MKLFFYFLLFVMPVTGMSKTVFSNQMLFKVGKEMVALSDLKLLIKNVEFFNCVSGPAIKLNMVTPKETQWKVLLNESRIDMQASSVQLVKDWQNFFILLNHINETRPDIFSVKSGVSKMAEMTKSSQCSRAQINHDVLKNILIIELYLNELSSLSQGQGTTLDQAALDRFLINLRQQVMIREYL